MSDPKCMCGGTICGVRKGKPLLRTYKCKGCKRQVPWCFGADDDLPHHCDDCWNKENM